MKSINNSYLNTDKIYKNNNYSKILTKYNSKISKMKTQLNNLNFNIKKSTTNNESLMINLIKLNKLS